MGDDQVVARSGLRCAVLKSRPHLEVIRGRNRKPTWYWQWECCDEPAIVERLARPGQSLPRISLCEVHAENIREASVHD